MPRTQSARKALRQNARHRSRNLARAKQLKVVLKQYRQLMTQGKSDEARGYLSTVYRTLDKVAKSGVMKRGKADRLKSRLSTKIQGQNR